VLLIPAAALSGRTIDWLLVKWTMSLVGLAGIALTWCYLRRASESGSVADIGALAVAANPYYWDFSHQAMAEGPLTAWLIGGLLLVDRVWAGRRVRAWEAGASGVVCGIGMLFKGHAVGLALVPLAYLAGRRRCALSAPSGATRWLSYLVGFLVPQVFWAIRKRWVIASGFEGVDHFRSIFAASPNDPSSRLMSWAEVGAHAVQNLRYYVAYRIPSQVLPGLWPDRLWGWKGSGVLAVALTLAILALAAPRRPVAWAACLVALPMALINVLYIIGGSERFWVPVTTMLTIAIVANHAPALVGPRPGTGRIGVAAVALLLAANLVVYIVHHERHPYDGNGPWRQLVQLFEEIGHLDDLRSSCLLTQSGNNIAFQLMTGCPAPLPQLGYRYRELIMESDRRMPPGSRILHSVGPWHMVELARPMTWEEVREYVPLAEGQFGGRGIER
jgi:hypothetical protein